jgi:hypothetical protein
VPAPLPEDLDYIGAFKAEMQKRGIRRAMIDEFMELWHCIPLTHPRLPCPICYAAGGWGQIDGVHVDGGNRFVRCRRCRNSIPLKGA